MHLRCHQPGMSGPRLAQAAIKEDAPGRVFLHISRRSLARYCQDGLHRLIEPGRQNSGEGAPHSGHTCLAEVHAPRPAEELVVVEASPPHSWCIDDGRHLREVAQQDMVEHLLIAVLQPAKTALSCCVHSAGLIKQWELGRCHGCCRSSWRVEQGMQSHEWACEGERESSGEAGAWCSSGQTCSS